MVEYNTDLTHVGTKINVGVKPNGVAIGPDDKIYVSGYESGNVYIYDKDGSKIHSIQVDSGTYIINVIML